MKLGLLVSESFRHWVMRAVRLLDSSKNCLICCQQVGPKCQKCPVSKTCHLLPTEATAPPGLSPSQGHRLPHTDTFSLTIFAPPLPLKDFAFWLKGCQAQSPLHQSSSDAHTPVLLGLSFTLTRTLVLLSLLFVIKASSSKQTRILECFGSYVEPAQELQCFLTPGLETHRMGLPQQRPAHVFWERM